MLPLAAHAARHDGIDTGAAAVGLLTPVHLHLGTEQVTLTDPDALRLDDADARMLFADLQPLFAGAGFALRWGTARRWYLLHESLAALPTASLDRVVGRNVDPWLPDAKAGRTWRRLQSEAQMLLHGHALNAQREACGLDAVNSLWLSGCGVVPAAATRAEPQLDERLRGPALAEDWAAWADAWRALDAGPIAALLDAGSDFTLTLAGERHALTYESAAASRWQRLRAAWQRPAIQAVLQSL